MTRPRRLWHAWALTGLLVAVTAVWLFTIFGSANVTVGAGASVVVADGALQILSRDAPSRPGLTWSLSGSGELAGLRAMRWWFGREGWTFYSPYGATSGTTYVIPLWFLWTLTALATAWLWISDRRRVPGACPACGYSRAGLAAGGPCPECGSPSRMAT